MPRLVKKTAHAPFVLGDKKICMCGLSQNQPFCDGSHLKTSDEDDSKLYWYENGKREEITQEADECGCDECQGHCGDGDEKCCGEGGCCKQDIKSADK